MENSRGVIYSSFIDFYNLKSGHLLFTISSLFSLIATLFSNLWLTKKGVFTLTKLAFSILSICSFLFYFIISYELSINYFYTVNAFYGLAIGALSITLNSLVSENASLENSSRLLSGLHSMYGLASLIAPIFVYQLFSLNSSIEKIFLIQAIFSVMILFVFLFVENKEENKDKSLLSFKYKKAELKLFFPIGLCIGLYVSSEVLISSRMSIFLIHKLSFSKEKAALYVSCFFLFLFLGRLVFSFIKIRMSKISMLKISMIFSLVFIILGIWFHPFFLCVSAFSMSYFFPYYMSYIGDHFKEVEKDLFSKSMNFVGLLLFITHWTYGIISEKYSDNWGIFISVIFLSISLYILQFILPKLFSLDKKLI